MVLVNLLKEAMEESGIETKFVTVTAKTPENQKFARTLESALNNLIRSRVQEELEKIIHSG